MNVDGSYRDDGSGGAGLIVRNEHGSVVGAWSKKLENMSSPLHAEAETARLGLLTALQQGWTNFEVECDCAVLVAALNRQSDDMVEELIGGTMFLDHIKKQASQFLQERYKTARLAFTDVTPAELWAEEATNGEPCSPDAKTMTKLAAASFEMEDYWRIVDILHRKLYNVDWKEWRQSYKVLVLLEFLLTHGPVDFAEEFQCDSEVIQELGSFKYIDDRGFDWGSCMQKKSDQLLVLLRGGPTLREARYKALKLTNEIQGFGSSVSSPSCSSTPSSAYSETPRASSFSSFSTTSSIWSELSNELFKSHQQSPTKSEAMESYSPVGLRDRYDDHDHYENTSNFPATSKGREESHIWNCPPIEENNSLLESEEEDDGDGDEYYEKDDGIISGICSKLVTLSPRRGNGPHSNIGFRSVSDVGMELRKKKLDRQSSFWY
ncbi:hypothetical protein ACLB2K_038425 [Fragaria x ananassa]